MASKPVVTWREVSAVTANPGVSLAAKGVLWLLLLRPPGTVLNRAELFAGNADPMRAIDTAITELARAGLVVVVPPKTRRQGRGSGGIKLPARDVRRPGDPVLDPRVAIGRQRAWWATAWVPVLPESQPIERDRKE